MILFRDVLRHGLGSRTTASFHFSFLNRPQQDHDPIILQPSNVITFHILKKNGNFEPYANCRESTRGLLAMDHVILNHGQVTWTTPELAPPLLTTTPHQREDVSALDRFNVHRCPTRQVFSGTGIELMTCLPCLDTLTTGLPQPSIINRKSISGLVVKITDSWQQCRFQLISGPGCRRFTSPLGTGGSKGDSWIRLSSAYLGPWAPPSSALWINLHCVAGSHKLEPSTTEDPSCREERYTLNMSRLKHPHWCDVEVRREVPAQVSSLSLDYGSKLRDPLPITLVQLYSATLIFTYSTPR
ncbi:uncharacterized protein TNCV_102071 [Trichonephila clavipes]|nr:uncharacterized protein TNCV_102071 [Trichonephila clavipes]